MLYPRTCELSKALDVAIEHVALPCALPLLLLPTRLDATYVLLTGQEKRSEC